MAGPLVRRHHGRMSRLLTLTAALALVACKGTATLPAQTLSVDGVERAYRLFVPETPPSAPMPLLLVVHGGGGRDGDFPQQEAFTALAEEEGVVLVFPLAEQVDGNEGEWQLNTTPESRQDIEYIGALIDSVAGDHAVDPSRVYATGYSLGSMFVYELVCQMSDRLAAVASHAGTMPVAPSDCDPPDEVAVLHIHGDQDAIIPYGQTWDWKDWDAVGTMHDVPSLVQSWADRFACGAASTTDGANADHVVHDACAGAVRVEHWRLRGGGHGWPDRIEGTSTPDVIWSFVSGFTRT